jgi:hypothetical protein
MTCTETNKLVLCGRGEMIASLPALIPHPCASMSSHYNKMPAQCAIQLPKETLSQADLAQRSMCCVIDLDHRVAPCSPAYMDAKNLLQYQLPYAENLRVSGNTITLHRSA